MLISLCPKSKRQTVEELEQREEWQAIHASFAATVKQEILMLPSTEYQKIRREEHSGWKCLIFVRKLSRRVPEFAVDTFQMETAAKNQALL